MSECYNIAKLRELFTDVSKDKVTLANEKEWYLIPFPTRQSFIN
jgi:hypothetical protein